MDDYNSDEVNTEIKKVLKNYQSERISGQWYIEQTGLNKVAKIIGGDYKKLTKKQRVKFREDCLNNVFDDIDVKTWWYYLNCA